MRALLVAIVLALALPAGAFRPTLTAGGATAGVGGGGGGGPFTFIASASGSDDASDTDVATSSTLNVASGDLLIAAVQWEDTDTTVTISDGTNSFTFDTGEDVHSASNEINLYPMYVLSASANATATFTATLGASRAYKKIAVMQYRPSGGTTSKDISGTRENNGSGSTITTGSFSTTGSDGVVCGTAGIYTSGTWVSPTINSVAADESVAPSGQTIWCRRVTASLSSVTASDSYTFSSFWAATAIAFKSE